MELTFPDGNSRQFNSGVRGADMAASISKSLFKKAVAMKLNGELRDLADVIDGDGLIEIVTREDPAALELVRHDAAHVMAEAVQALWPDTQATIGPIIENGYYYDFARDEPFRPEDLEKIEKEMVRIIERNEPFEKEIWFREDAIAYFRDKGESYKVELINALGEDEDVRIYRQGQWLDLCRGPHMTSTGKIG